MPPAAPAAACQPPADRPCWRRWHRRVAPAGAADRTSQASRGRGRTQSSRRHAGIPQTTTLTAAGPMRRFNPAAARGLGDSDRAGLKAVEPPRRPLSRPMPTRPATWPNRPICRCNRPHRYHGAAHLPRLSQESRWSRSGHGRRKWSITLTEWQVQMHMHNRISDSLDAVKLKVYTTRMG